MGKKVEQEITKGSIVYFMPSRVPARVTEIGEDGRISGRPVNENNQLRFWRFRQSDVTVIPASQAAQFVDFVSCFK